MKRVALLSAFLCLLVGCGEPPDGDSLKVYRHAEDGVPTSLDPVHAVTVYGNMMVVNLYDTLYRYKYLARPYEITPNLATGFPEVSADGLIYTFRIKPGTRFADDPAFSDGIGREVTVHDLIYSLQRHFDPAVRSQGAWLWQGRILGLDEWAAAGADYDVAVDGLVALDDHTLEIHLNAPYPQLVFTLGHGFAALVPREAVEHYGREFAIRPVGSGPFRLTRFDSTRAVMVRNPHFRREVLDLAAEGFDPDTQGDYGLERLDGKRYPFLDRVEVSFIEETATRWTSFVRGTEVQNVMVPREHIDQVLASRDPLVLEPAIAERYHSYSSPEAGFVFFGFNMDDDRLGYHDDPEHNERNRALRCAMRDAYDWDAMNQMIFYGLGEVFPGAIPPVVPEFDPALSRDSVTHQLERGRQALRAAGWHPENLPTLNFGTVSGVQQRQIFELFRARMQELGFPGGKITFEGFATFGDFNRALSQRQLAIFPLGWTLAYPDAEYVLQLFYGPNAAPGANNFNYRNPQFDELFRQASVLQPGPERTALYRRMNQLIIDDCVALVGVSRTRVHLWHKDVTMVPDREILDGYFIRFVDVIEGDG